MPASPNPAPQARVGSLQCEDCGRSSLDVSYCNACELLLCDRCWDKQLQHRKRLPRLGGAIHEKIDPRIAEQINNVFSQALDESASRSSHAKDERTAWFGLEQPSEQDQPLVFRDYGRYAELMATSSSPYILEFPAKQEQSPSLVSFVGETGAGKSTVIRLLMESVSQSSTRPFSTPVIGMIGKDIPTSEGVHLYADPSSSRTKAPLLYADTEGLDGGERQPFASTVRDDTLSRGQHHIDREVLWAKSHTQRTRSYAVSEFYPRVLFTFSDVVLFVHRNSRSIEVVLKRLIAWAEAALETASNQPILPCAIVVLNASDFMPEHDAWDVENATRTLLDSLSDTVNKNDVFATYSEIWRKRGRTINSVKELFMCYFSSFKVVYIPTNAQPMLMHDQVWKLYTEILSGCEMVRQRKISLRFLLNAQELHSYLQHAFDHFSQFIDVPFDFVQAAFANRQIPDTFGRTVLQLAIRMMKQEHKPGLRAIFNRLSFLIASCIMLDAARNQIKGTADHIFPNFIEDLDNALRDFCDQHWPCEFVVTGVDYPRAEMRRSDFWMPERELYRCVNVRCGHTKGHQSEDGRIFETGDYISSFSFEGYRDEFLAAVYFRLQHMLERLADLEISGERPDGALYLHRDDILRSFFKPKRDNKIIADSTICLSCLMNPPEHALPCGHVLCTACAKGYGHIIRKNIVEIQECPIHDEESGLFQPWLLHLKPDTAGVRVLTLDDGGIRSVLQLEILHLIETELDGRLSTPQLFDLVVGTGTGSLIALQLASGEWTIDGCSKLLKDVCIEAFENQTRPLLAINWKRGSFSRHKFHSRGLETALKGKFTDNRSLSSTLGNGEMAVKVAIVTGATDKTTVLTNYRHSTLSKLPYDIHSPQDLADEMKAWEVVRASMSNSNYFKPFRHSSLKQPFSTTRPLNTTLCFVSEGERRRTFRVQPYAYPDVLVSLGSGAERERPITASKRPRSKPDATEEVEKSWQTFLSNLPNDAPAGNFLRIDPLMEEVPQPDDLDSMNYIPLAIRSYVNMMDIRNLALQLFARLFYFEPLDFGGSLKNELDIQGSILCRFSDKSKAVYNVGRLLKTKFAGSCFLVRGDGVNFQRISIPVRNIENMVTRAEFQVPMVQARLARKIDNIDIVLELENAEMISISGFPCSLSAIRDQTRKRFRSKFWAPTQSRRPVWVPPNRERFASLDLDSWKALTPSDRSIVSGSSPSISSSSRSRDPRESGSTRSAYDLQSMYSERSRSTIEEEPLKKDQIASLEEALMDAERLQRAIREKLAEVKGDFESVSISSLRPFP